MKPLARVTYPGSNRLHSGTRTKAVVKPPHVVVVPHTEEIPTVEELLLMFEEDTLVGDNPLSELITDSDIEDETYLVDPNELLTLTDTTLSDVTTEVTPAQVELKVYYTRCPAATDVDLIPSFAWSLESYLMSGDEEFVCTTTIDGFVVQVYRTPDGFAAQPIG